MTKKTYAEKLKDPRWQKKRLEIMNRDNFTCQKCGDTKTTLVVHHFEYSGEPWDVKNEGLITVCETCHKVIEVIKDLVDTKSSSFRLTHYDSDTGESITGFVSDKYSALLLSYNKQKASVVLSDEVIIKLQEIINNYKNLNQ